MSEAETILAPLPCPFCGGTADFRYEPTGALEDICCTGCDCIMFAGTGDKESTISAWNARVPSPIDRLAREVAEAADARARVAREILPVYARHGTEKSEASFAAREECERLLKDAFVTEAKALAAYLAARDGGSRES